MNILVTLDRNYLPPLRVMLGSLLRNDPGETFEIYAIGDGLMPEDCESAFVPAAAWMVLAWLQAGEAGVASFTAGNLTIHRTGQGAAELTAQAERLMAPYLVDGGFSFQGVAG